MHYLFGDTDLAARRLEVLAEVFAESTRAFLLAADIDRQRLAVDLGCGPGYSTHLLSDLLECDHVAGLDRSEHFISLAQKTKEENVSFHLHDVATVPFPVGPGDLLFCRFLLTHVREPQAVVAKCVTQLRPKGLLLMEETEWIDTENAVFATYVEIVEAMLEHQRTSLYVGPALNSLENLDTLRKRMSRIGRLAVTNDRAATMFFLNMQTWKRNPFVQENYSPAVLDQLEGNLRALAEEPTSERGIEWGLRQLVYERV